MKTHSALGEKNAAFEMKLDRSLATRIMFSTKDSQFFMSSTRGKALHRSDHGKISILKFFVFPLLHHPFKLYVKTVDRRAFGSATSMKMLPRSMHHP